MVSSAETARYQILIYRSFIIAQSLPHRQRSSSLTFNITVSYQSPSSFKVRKIFSTFYQKFMLIVDHWRDSLVVLLIAPVLDKCSRFCAACLSSAITFPLISQCSYSRHIVIVVDFSLG